MTPLLQNSVDEFVQLNRFSSTAAMKSHTDDKDNLVFELELSGVKKQDITIKSAVGLIYLSWAKKGIVKSCFWKLQNGYNTMSLKAKYEGNVLAITIPINRYPELKACIIE
jgi:HSP20 family molecular chaperone IbpA